MDGAWESMRRSKDGGREARALRLFFFFLIKI